MTCFFLGFSKNEAFEKKIINPSLFVLWTQGEDYLENIFFENKAYLGKKIANPTWEALCDLQKHILSLVFRLAPGYPISTDQIELFVLNGESHHGRKGGGGETAR